MSSQSPNGSRTTFVPNVDFAGLAYWLRTRCNIPILGFQTSHLTDHVYVRFDKFEVPILIISRAEIENSHSVVDMVSTRTGFWWELIQEMEEMTQ